jgi:hypothetical protein
MSTVFQDALAELVAGWDEAVPCGSVFPCSNEAVCGLISTAAITAPSAPTTSCGGCTTSPKGSLGAAAVFVVRTVAKRNFTKANV